MTRTTEHWPHAQAPDFGGLQGRFADIRNRRETSLFWERFATAAQMILGAVAGLVVAWVL